MCCLSGGMIGNISTTAVSNCHIGSRRTQNLCCTVYQSLQGQVQCSKRGTAPCLDSVESSVRLSHCPPRSHCRIAIRRWLETPLSAHGRSCMQRVLPHRGADARSQAEMPFRIRAPQSLRLAGDRSEIIMAERGRRGCRCDCGKDGWRCQRLAGVSQFFSFFSLLQFRLTHYSANF